MSDLSLDGVSEALEGRLGPVRVGIDLVEVAEVAASVGAFGDRYLERIYAPAELAYCRRAAVDPAPHLAARFAAKEATVKVLRPSAADEGIDWRSIEVVRTPDGDGWCQIALTGAAARLAARQALTDFQVSLSHAAHYAVAVVVAAAADPGAQDS
jgi:holo-[acyl-carrier protein] synthase